jgi:hypothetical protein
MLTHAMLLRDLGDRLDVALAKNLHHLFVAESPGRHLRASRWAVIQELAAVRRSERKDERAPSRTCETLAREQEEQSELAKRS